MAGDRRYMFLMSRAGSALRAHLHKELASRGINLSIGAIGVLFLLRGRDGQTMSELCDGLKTDNGAMTRLVDRLEKCGYVRRVTDPDDRRQNRVTLTEGGLAAATGAISIVHRANERIAEGFTAEEVDAFLRILQSMEKKFS